MTYVFRNVVSYVRHQAAISSNLYFKKQADEEVFMPVYVTVFRPVGFVVKSQIRKLLSNK
jgi:hypothetical protein